MKATKKPAAIAKPKFVRAETRAGIVFGVGRISRRLRKGKYCPRVGKYTPLIMAAALEYLATEVMELAGDVTKYYNKTIITPRHLALAIFEDPEVKKLVGNATIPQSGVPIRIHPQLFPKESKKIINKGEADDYYTQNMEAK